MSVERIEHTSRVRKTVGTYSFRVEGYSAISTKVGESIESPEFFICNHDWQLRIFPGGSLEAHQGYCSFYLASKSSRIVRASYKLILISQVIGGSNEIFVSSGVRTFEAKGVQVDGWGRDKFLSLSTLMDTDNGFFVDDSVIFQVEITVIGELEPTKTPENKFNNLHFTLRDNLMHLLQNRELADLTISVGSSQFYVHKCIICARSPVFFAMFSGCKLAESSTGTVVINDIDECVLEELIHFIYTDELSNESVLDAMADALLCAASKYQIDGLINLCEEYIGNQISFDNAVSILVLADSFHALKLKEKVLQFMGHNFSTIIQTKEFQDLGGDLLKEAKIVLEMASKRQGCRGMIDGERKFGSSCSIM